MPPTHDATVLAPLPGLPTRPVFYDVDVDLKTGKVLGLF
jgi:formyltetrahydrofolate synthetase